LQDIFTFRGEFTAASLKLKNMAEAHAVIKAFRGEFTAASLKLGGQGCDPHRRLLSAVNSPRPH